MRVLITGITGLIGQEIKTLCLEEGIEIHYLTRNRGKIKDSPGLKGFYWKPEQGEMDAACLEEVDAIINLAGSSIFKKWNKHNRKEIIESRIESLNLLNKTLQNNSHQVAQIITASAIGIYPSSLGKLYSENEKEKSPAFLGRVVDEWEQAADQFTKLGIKVAKLRIGLVLSEKGGAFPKLKLAASNYMAAAFGSGRQWQSWIHIEDLSRMFVFILNQQVEGVYNAVAPNPVTNEYLNDKLSRALRRRRILKKIPAPFLKFAMGEMAAITLESQRVSSKKIESEGFRFKYRSIKKALKDLT